MVCILFLPFALTNPIRMEMNVYVNVDCKEGSNKFNNFNRFVSTYAAFRIAELYFADFIFV